jgi:hypothetical protein
MGEVTVAGEEKLLGIDREKLREIDWNRSEGMVFARTVIK